jgi:hypothetical protein
MAKPTSLGGSFTIANQPAPRRLVLAIDGLEKTGKTRLALTAPGPLAYMSLDIGVEGVIEPFQTEKVIHLAEYGVRVEKGDTQDTLIKKAEPEWARFLKDYKDIVIPGLKAGTIRTCIWDTATEVWELLRLARLGKLQQVLPHHYVGVNSEFQNLLREVYETPGNLILLHKLKAEWKDNPATGKGQKTGLYERAGYAGTGFLVQVNASCWRERMNGDPAGMPSGSFHVTLRDSRQNATVAGTDLSDEMCTFGWIAMNVYPDSDLSEWGG